MPSIKGTASVEDSRSLSKAMRSIKFPAIFKTEVDISKVNRSVMEQWIGTQITSLLGFEDEIVQSTATNLFLPEQPEESLMPVTVDPRRAQIDMAGFLGDAPAAKFAAEVWEMIIDAANEPTGIPRKLLEEKKKELAKKQLEAEKPQPRERDERRRDVPDRQRAEPNGNDSRRPRRVEDDRYEEQRDNYRRRSFRDESYDPRRSPHGRRYPDDRYGYDNRRRPDYYPPPDTWWNNDDRRRDEYDEYGRRRYRDDRDRGRRDGRSRDVGDRERGRERRGRGHRRRRSRSSSRSSTGSSSSDSSRGSSRSRS